ncbi:hypothetical protein GCM10007924_26740 [Sneathiella chinensis]|uniref:Uncharacterized protein n=1 Tax=Sneathiella chinensis TaxID=349750 RepID=A0ABQ5U6Y9_9PROT|nr:hypothetical protein GCM10007924_26740 [Sneathiella chinensis]
MAGAGKGETGNLVLTGTPDQFGGAGKQVGGVGGTGVFLAMVAVTQEEMFERAVNFKTDRAAEA